MADRHRHPLRVLILEDDPLDAALMVAELRRAGFDPQWQRVETEAAYLAALHPDLDVILSDFNIPHFDALRALGLLRARNFTTPFIIVSGSIGEDQARDALAHSATDYLLKDRQARLGPAVARALEQRQLQHGKRQAESALGVAEARIRFALEASRVGTWEVDVDTGVTRWSAILEALHGLPAGTFGGTREAFIDCVHPDDRPLVHETMALAPSPRTTSRITYRTVWPDGSVHWISRIGQSMPEGDDGPRRAAGIAMDVTEYRTLEDQYRQSQKMDAVGQLAGGIAHDYNNLLTAIQGFTELLAEDLGPESPHQDDLDQIRRAAASAASLTRQLLTFSRREMVEPRALDLRQALTSMQAILKRLIGEDIEVAVVSDPDLWVVTADRGQMEQVLLNLVLNARDAMPDGGKLLIELMNVELDESYTALHVGASPGPYVMLAVSDTGIGMTAAVRDRLFEPFYTTKPPGKGTGLGLSTVYGIVQQSGGHIGVYSEPGRGATFKVYLPRTTAPLDVAPRPDVAGSVDGTEVVLVVDDEHALCALVQKSLERHGYRVITAATPHRALEMAQSAGTIDLLLTDIVLAHMNGTVLAARLRAHRPGLRVLYMSGYTENGIVHRGVLESRVPFLQKPFTPAKLLRTVRDVLDLPSVS
jgi:two-component system cell cycle sensor histidine kinase/response regulator CckA